MIPMNYCVKSFTNNAPSQAAAKIDSVTAEQGGDIAEDEHCSVDQLLQSHEEHCCCHMSH